MLDQSSETILDQTLDQTLSLANSSQAQLELLYSKYQLHKCIAREAVDAGAEEDLTAMDIPVDFGVDLIVQMVLHKRADVSTLVGLLKKHFTDHENPAQACADMLFKAVGQDVVDLDELFVNDDETGQRVRKHIFVVRHDISHELQEKLDQFQYPLPMIEEPKTVIHNRQTGYQTITGSLILRNNHHEDDICLDHINRMNQIPLALNTDVIAFVQNKWRNLDKAKPGESYHKFKARKAAFEKYDRTSRDVLAALLAHGNRIWLTHKYDKRGRTYSQGYHVNYQGADWNKACIEFADAEPLNKE